jgi:hypothetical protein
MSPDPIDYLRHILNEFGFFEKGGRNNDKKN